MTQTDDSPRQVALKAVKDTIAEAQDYVISAYTCLSHERLNAASVYSLHARLMLAQGGEILQAMIEKSCAGANDAEKSILNQLRFDTIALESASYHLEAIADERIGMADYDPCKRQLKNDRGRERLKAAALNYGKAYGAVMKAEALCGSNKFSLNLDTRDSVGTSLQKIVDDWSRVCRVLGREEYEKAVVQIQEVMPNSECSAKEPVTLSCNTALEWYGLAMHIHDEAKTHNLAVDPRITAALEEKINRLFCIMDYMQHAMQKVTISPKGHPEHEVKIYNN